MIFRGWPRQGVCAACPLAPSGGLGVPHHTRVNGTKLNMFCLCVKNRESKVQALSVNHILNVFVVVKCEGVSWEFHTTLGLLGPRTPLQRVLFVCCR